MRCAIPFPSSVSSVRVYFRRGPTASAGAARVNAIPILAVTGLLGKAERARASQLGFTDYVFKPVEPSRLLQIVRAYVPRGLPRGPRRKLRGHASAEP